jgi:hypothetical protein
MHPIKKDDTHFNTDGNETHKKSVGKLLKAKSDSGARIAFC